MPIKFNIKTAILGLFSIVILLISSILMYFQYAQIEKFTKAKTEQDFKNIIESTVQELKSYDATSINFINIVQNMRDINTNLNRSNTHPLFPVIIDYIKNSPHIYAIYLGYGNDNFYIIYNVNLSKSMKESLEAPDNSSWMIKHQVKKDKKLMVQNSFLDENLHIIKSYEHKSNFQPTKRPWYKNAINSDQIIKTKPYIFAALGQPGITYAKEVNFEQGIVLAVDITLDSLNKLLNKYTLIEGSNVFIHDKDGHILASRNNEAQNDLVNQKHIFNEVFFKNKKLMHIDKEQIITYNNQDYLKYTHQIHLNNINTYISFLVPYDPLIQPYRQEAIEYIVITNILVMLLAAPLMFFSINRIAKPILQLKEANKKIEQGDFDNIDGIPSYLNEIKDLACSFKKMAKSLKEQRDNNNALIKIANALSSIKDYDKILETILLGTKDIVNADGGTLYLYNKEQECLDFSIAINSSLDIHIGGTKEKVKWKPINIYDENHHINKKNISVISAMEERIILINDLYENREFDFQGVKAFDLDNHYKTSSMLVIPIKDRDGELVAVLQLINKRQERKQANFNENDKFLAKSMAELSAMTLHNNKLIVDLEKLLYTLVESIGNALGEKSNYTKKHIDKVASLAMTIAQAVNSDTTMYQHINFSDEELEEIRLAAWLHDIGKITTPEHVVDKATKLETLYDRIHTVKAKIEIAKRDIEIEHLKSNISYDNFQNELKQLEKDFEFISKINIGGKSMSDACYAQLENIYNKYKIRINNQEQRLFTQDEYYNLSIQRGTLTKEERDIINNHVLVSYTMLNALPFPKRFENVPKIAGSHHKTIDGKGYAHEDILHLEMTLSDKILALADVFEALSAHDRPYRKPNTITQIASILLRMVDEQHLDKELVEFFLTQNVYAEYVQQHFLEDQIDKP